MSLREKFWAGLAFVCIIWFHLYGILMVFCAGVYALLVHCREERRRTVLWCAVKFFLCVLLIAMPLWCYSIFFAQAVNVKAMAIGREIQTFEYIPNPLMDPVGFARAIFGNLMGFKAVYLLGLKIKIKWLVNGILLALLIPQKDRFKQLGFFLVMIVLPLQLLFLADLFNQYWFIQRQFVWVMAWYAFFLGWCWDSVITATVDWVKIKRQSFKKQPVTA